MSEKNIETIRAVYAAWLSGDERRLLEHIDPDVVFMAPADMSGGSRTFRGHAGLAEGIAEWVREWDDYRFELRDLLADGNEVLAVVWQTGRGKGSGVEVAELIYNVWTVRSGRAVRLRMFRNRREALEAVGLPSSA